MASKEITYQHKRLTTELINCERDDTLHHLGYNEIYEVLYCMGCHQNVPEMRDTKTMYGSNSMPRTTLVRELQRSDGEPAYFNYEIPESFDGVTHYYDYRA